MREIFERSEFQRSKSLVERILDWIARRFGGPSDAAVGGSAWGGAVADIVLWVVLALLAVGLVLLIVQVVRNRRPKAKKTGKPPADVEVEEQRSASEWSSEAERLEADGRWKEAIRCRYRELVARLVDAGVAVPLAGRTTGELRSDVAGKAPEAAPEFSQATGLFELPWYADAPTGPVESEQFKALAADVLEKVS